VQLDEWTWHADWLQAQLERTGPLFFALLLQTTGSTLRKAGACCWFTPDQEQASGNLLAQGASGVLSGGCMEKALYRAACDMQGDAVTTSIVNFDSRDPHDAWLGYGKGCPGAATILLHQIDRSLLPDWCAFLNAAGQKQLAITLDALAVGPRHGSLQVVPKMEAKPWDEITPRLLLQRPATKQLIVIARHQDALPLVALACDLAWDVHLVAPDDLLALAGSNVTPHTFAAGFTSVLARAANPERTAVLSLSHKFEDDIALLHQAMQRPFFYRGIMGGKLKHELLTQELAAHHGAPDFFCPIGVPRSGDSPGHIALSVMAELEAKLAKDATPLLRQYA
jgi:xanthine/CO dehydrogenase XdhC/CoxF family maturation factor